MPGTKKTKRTVRAVSPSTKQKNTISRSAATRAIARVATGSPLTPADQARLEQIRQLEAARAAAELKDVLDVLKELERMEPSLGGGGSVLPMGPSGSERGSGSARDDRQAFMPSMDLSSYMRGAARQDGGGGKQPQTDNEPKSDTWTTRGEDGTTTVHTRVHNSENGSTTTTHRTHDGDRETRYVLITDYADGSSEGVTRATLPDGTTVTHTWSTDPSGNFVTDHFTTEDSQGRLVEEWDRADSRRRGFVRLPTDDETTELGRALGARFSHGAKKPAPVVTHVNPGDPDASGPQAPRFNPGERIVVNPAPDAAGQQAREVSAERAKHWQQQLRDKVGGHVNPPGPSDVPKK